jgi:hypothetical protein
MMGTAISRGLIATNHKVINRNRANRERGISSEAVFSVSSTRFFECLEELQVS